MNKIKANEIKFVDGSSVFYATINEIIGNNDPKRNYQVSSCGDVLLNGDRMSTRSGGYKKRYLRVQIKRVDHYVHRLVLKAFLGSPTPGHQACHNDGNPHNNKLSNLRWDTPANNTIDKINHGTSGKGDKNAMAKLCSSQVENIVKLYSVVSVGDLAKCYNISRSNISMIVTGKTWHNSDHSHYYDMNKRIAKRRIFTAPRGIK